MKAIVRYLPNLQVLNVEGTHCVSDKKLIMIGNSLLALRELNISGSHLWAANEDDRDRIVSLFADLPKTFFAQLRKLSIRNYQHRHLKRILLYILRRCDNLQELDMGYNYAMSR